MKYLILASIFCSFSAFAQTANIKDIPLDKEQDTNISISTGKKETNTKKFEIVSETAEVVGEPESLSKDARTSWKKACAEWKAETKELNKDNKVISLNCGQPKCEKSESVTTTCKSDATYKIKVKLE